MRGDEVGGVRVDVYRNTRVVQVSSLYRLRVLTCIEIHDFFTACLSSDLINIEF